MQELRVGAMIAEQWGRSERFKKGANPLALRTSVKGGPRPSHVPGAGAGHRGPLEEAHTVGQRGAWRASMPALQGAGQTDEEGHPDIEKQKGMANDAQENPCEKKEGIQ